MLIISFLFGSHEAFSQWYFVRYLEQGRNRFLPKDDSCLSVLRPVYFLSINRVFEGPRPYNANMLGYIDKQTEIMAR